MKKKLALIMVLFTIISMFMLSFEQANKNGIVVGGPNDDDKIPIDVYSINDKVNS